MAPRTLARTALLLGLATSMAACSSSSARSFEVGLRRVAVDLTYTDEDKLPPPVAATPQQIEESPPPISVPGFVTQIAPSLVVPPATTPRTPTKPVVACPKASADARPKLPVRVFVTDPPATGLFPTKVSGTFAAATALGTLKGPLPKTGQFEIKNLRRTETSSVVDGPTTVITYDVVEPTLDGGVQTTTYQSTNSPSGIPGQVQRTAGIGPQPTGELELVSQSTNVGGKISTFTPSPPITIMSFKSGEGTSWQSAGIDQVTGTSMVVQGSIERREVLDVCGTLYDTYRVVSTERIVNLRSGFTKSTSTSEPNVYNVATQLGGLFISRTEHTVTEAPTANGAGTTSITLDYTATVTTATPIAP